MADPETQHCDEAPAPEYSEDGVDLSLIRLMLKLTPMERLGMLEEHLQGLEALLELHARQ